MKKSTSIIAFLTLCLGLSANCAFAADWSYDFETALDDIGDRHSLKENITLNGINWKLNGMRSGNASSDWKNGKCSGRIYGEKMSDKDMPFMEMIQDKDGGVGTISFSYKAYSEHLDTQIPWIVQVSENEGQNWVKVGDQFTPSDEVQTFTTTANYSKGRMRIVRADYLTYDHTLISKFQSAFNIDDLSITDSKEVSPSRPSIVPEQDVVTFPETYKKESTELIVKFAYSNLTEPITLNFSEPTSNFSISTNTIEVSEHGTAEFTATFCPQETGNMIATIVLTSGEATAQIALKGSAIRKAGVYSFSGGAGTEEEPYLISNPADLYEMSDAIVIDGTTFENTYFQMTQDIDMTGMNDFVPIGNNYGASAVQHPFMGTFNGENHTISNLSVSFSGMNYMGVGLFGLTQDATIKNVIITNSSFTADAIVGSIVGVAIGGSITNCHAGENVSVTAKTNFYSGGIIAAAMDKPVHITDCSSMAEVYTGNMATGGILATNAAEGTSIERCINYGNVTAENDTAGGILGFAEFGINIIDCANVGTITTFAATAGGIAAAAVMPTYPVHLGIHNCYNVGQVSTGSYITTKPMGDITDIQVTNCYYLEEMANQEPAYFGVGMLITEMLDGTLLEKLNAGRKPIVWSQKSDVNNGLPVPENLNGALSGISQLPVDSDINVTITNGMVNIPEGYRAVRIYDMNGRSFNASNTLPSGTYLIVIIKNGEPLKPMLFKVLSR